MNLHRITDFDDFMRHYPLIDEVELAIGTKQDVIKGVIDGPMVAYSLQDNGIVRGIVIVTYSGDNAFIVLVNARKLGAVTMELLQKEFKSFGCKTISTLSSVVDRDDWHGLKKKYVAYEGAVN